MHQRRLLRVLPASRRHIHSQQSVIDAVQEIYERLNHVSDCPVASSVLDSARIDAKVLVANALLPPLAASSDIFFHSERKLTESEAAKLNASVEQRARGKPLAYVIGQKEFWSLEFKVTEDTLIPRSDSEVLIEALVEQFHPQMPLRILDIGTGSGCLLLSTLSEFPFASGVGIDISPGALAVAKHNAQLHRLDDRAEFLIRDLKMLPELRHDVAEDQVLYQRFDVILCNPPYIPSREVNLVRPDVLEFEPHLALFSGGGPNEDSEVDPEGLRMYRWLHQSVGSLFRTNNRGVEMNRASTQDGKSSGLCLLMEIGLEEQARAVRQIFSNMDVTQRDDGLQLRFERFLFDASGKYRGLLFLFP